MVARDGGASVDILSFKTLTKRPAQRTSWSSIEACKVNDGTSSASFRDAEAGVTPEAPRSQLPLSGLG
jgi:hypothetical protein